MRDFYEIINKEKVDDLDSKEVVNVLIKFIELIRKTKDRSDCLCVQIGEFINNNLITIEESRVIIELIYNHPTVYYTNVGIYYFPVNNWRLRLSYLRKLIKIYSK